MLQRMSALLQKYRGELTYLVFGVLTTAVNYAVFLPCSHVFKYAAVSNAIAWVVAVLFSFFTNKPFVFESHDWSLRVVLPEFLKFVGTRLASGLLETGILAVAVDGLHGNKVVWKVITNVIVVVLNYIGSKLLVFCRKK